MNALDEIKQALAKSEVMVEEYIKKLEGENEQLKKENKELKEIADNL